MIFQIMRIERRGCFVLLYLLVGFAERETQEKQIGIICGP
jgi:hypothetical protein